MNTKKRIETITAEKALKEAMENAREIQDEELEKEEYKNDD